MKAWVQKSVLLVVGLGIVLFGLSRGIRQQIQRADEQVTSISDLKDPSPFRAALLGHLDKIHISLTSFTQTHESSLPAQISEGESDFEASIPEFHRQNARLFPDTAQNSILKEYGILKGLMDRLLHSSEEQAQRRSQSESQYKDMLFILKDRIRPLLRGRGASGDERLAMVLKLENQLRTLQQDITHAWEEPVSDGVPRSILEDQDRGHSLIENYLAMDLLKAERRNALEFQRIWNTHADLTRDIFVFRWSEKQTVDLVKISRQMLLATLHRLLPALEPTVMESQKSALLRSMRMHMAIAGVLCVSAFALTIGGVLMIYRWRPQQAHPAKAAVTADPTLTIDLQGMIRQWGDSAQTLYGYTADEVMGKSLSLLFVSETEIEHFYKEIRSDKKTAIEGRHKKKSGVEMAVQMSFHSATDADGHVNAIRISCLRR